MNITDLEKYLPRRKFGFIYKRTAPCAKVCTCLFCLHAKGDARSKYYSTIQCFGHDTIRQSNEGHVHRFVLWSIVVENRAYSNFNKARIRQRLLVQWERWVMHANAMTLVVFMYLCTSFIKLVGRAK